MISENIKIPDTPGPLLTWMQNNIKYDNYPNFTRSPDKILKDQKANCVDGSAFIEIKLRCNGFKTRFVFALVQTKTMRSPHVWVQFKDPESKKWIDIDATSKSHKLGDTYPILEFYAYLNDLGRFGAVKGGCSKWTRILQ